MERLAELRESQALTLRDLAEKSVVDANTINQVELGHSKPRPSTLRKLARALGVDVEEFAEPALAGKAEAPPSQDPLFNNRSEERGYRPTTREVNHIGLFCTKVERRLDAERMSPDEIDIALDAIEGFVAVVGATMSDAVFMRFIRLGHRLLEAAKAANIRNTAEVEAGVTRLEEWKDRRVG